MRAVAEITVRPAVAVREIDVAGKACHGQHRFREGQKILGSQHRGRGYDAEEDNAEQSRKNPANPALVKIDDGKISLGNILGHQRGNQIAGDDKKDVNADKPAGKSRYLRVEKDNRQDRDGAKAVNVRAVLVKLREA